MMRSTDGLLTILAKRIIFIRKKKEESLLLFSLLNLGLLNREN